MCINTCTLHVDLLLYLAGVDYNEITNERVVFNPGVSTQTVTLTTLSDALSEGDEDLTATITVAADSGIGVFAPEASVTITESGMFPCVCIYVHLYIVSPPSHLNGLVSPPSHLNGLIFLCVCVCVCVCQVTSHLWSVYLS